MRTFGQCLGAAVIGVILSVCAPSGSLAQEAFAVRLGLWLAADTTLLAIVVSLSRLKVRPAT